MTPAVTLLGPQRRPSIQPVLRDLDPTAPIATVTAGWQEREPEDAELQELLGGGGVSLSLYSRWRDVHEQDREYAFAERDHDEALVELRRLYLSQLDHALAGAYAVAQEREGRPRLRDTALRDAVEVVRLVDQHHLARVRAVQQAFYSAWPPHERPAVDHHRSEVARILQEAQAVVVAGGHVGDLTRVLHLFNVGPHLPDVVIAWSAGAMALCERVVLFHDFVPHGVAQTEVFAEGLGVLSELVPLPHARRRLRVDDSVAMSVLARRFAPARCLVLDDGVRVPLGPDGQLPAEARVLTEDGRVGEVEAA